MILETKALGPKVILNGCPASKVKVSLDTTGKRKIKLANGQEMSTYPLYGEWLIYPYRVLGRQAQEG